MRWPSKISLKKHGYLGPHNYICHFQFQVLSKMRIIYQYNYNTENVESSSKL